MQRKEVNKIMKVLTLILTFSIIVVLSRATPTLFTRLEPQINQFSALDATKPQNLDEQNCKYRSTIKTSCLSPIHTNDIITLSFGDATHDGTIDVENLGGPQNKRLEACVTVELGLEGPCRDKICKVLISRSGPHSSVPKFDDDSWIAEYVTIEDYKNPPIRFDFKPKDIIIPDDGYGYGLDYCPKD
ncbi:embryo-specific protein ATS3B-like [Cicer arietinum]|uniref:Embryo-specific protein ATS3B-like n=1 Tax=Cicer arietinum TaxID=3827 RepID=A0A1S2XFL1_CICAR|nr:embryo-specific protein ATS3B-like [Cicer arietinum]